MIVATHNLMHGLKLDALVSHYHRLREQRGLDLLCVQENRGPVGAHTRHIAAELGPGYRELSAPDRCGKGIVYDTRALRLVEHRVAPLPRLARLGWLERRYIRGGVPDQRFAQIARFESPSGSAVRVINFHLDTAGGNAHRRRQVAAIAELIGAEPTLVCGDTNAFSLRAHRHAELIEWLMEPLAPFGMTVADSRAPTHFFARQDEPMLAHQLLRMVGRLGIDWPLRYDVVCTNLEVRGCGVVATPESDHDLVWTQLTLTPKKTPGPDQGPGAT